MGKNKLHGPSTLPFRRHVPDDAPRATSILIDITEEERLDLANDRYIESLCELDRRLKGEET